MTQDWKNALSSLRGSLEEIPEENSVSEETQDKAKETQKVPLTVVLDKKGRNGKMATIIEGFTLPQEEVELIASKLKKQLGVGGSCRQGEILVQGDRKEAVIKFLQSLNFKTR